MSNEYDDNHILYDVTFAKSCDFNQKSKNNYFFRTKCVQT